MPTMTINEAARLRGVSPDTIRRHIRMGLLTARKEHTPRGIRWLVEEPDASETPLRIDVSEAAVRGMQEALEVLREELEARRREAWQLQGLLKRTLHLLGGLDDGDTSTEKA